MSFTVTRGARIDLLFTMSDNLRAIGVHLSTHRESARIEFLTNELFELAAAGQSATTSGGARRDRTDDLLLAKQALSQLSYGPAPVSVGWLAEP